MHCGDWRLETFCRKCNKISGFSRNHKIESPTSRQEAQTRGSLQKIPPAQLSVGINTDSEVSEAVGSSVLTALTLRNLNIIRVSP